MAVSARACCSLSAFLNDACESSIHLMVIEKRKYRNDAAHVSIWLAQYVADMVAPSPHIS
jgi:hypothetical protein